MVRRRGDDTIGVFGPTGRGAPAARAIPPPREPLSPTFSLRFPRRRLLVVLVTAALLATGCAGNGRRSAGAGAPVADLIGAGDRAVLAGGGSTLAASMVEEWATLYRQRAPGVDVRYDAIGSGAGVRHLIDRTADFAVSEAPMTAEEQRSAGWDEVVQVPVAGAAVAVAYNLPGVDDLHLSEDTLARIYSGAITRWDAAAIKRENPGAALPAMAVTTVHRSDSSGSTLAFTRYLLTAGHEVWTPGAGTSVDWPVGKEAAGTAGVVAAVGASRGAIGYVGAEPAHAARLQVATVRNAAGAFVAPTSVAVDTALLGATGFKENLTLTVPDRHESPTAYPVVAISHLVFPAGLAAEKDAALRHFAAWILTEGQRSTRRLGLAPLPLPLLVRTLEGLQNGGTKPSR
jgi:phosphate transport system substrate-binding protein